MYKNIYILHSLNSDNTKDEIFAKSLRKAFSSLCQSNNVELSCEIMAGSNTNEYIEKAIERSDLLICIISNDFTHEYRSFFDQIRQKSYKLLPIEFRKTSLLELTCFNKNTLVKNLTPNDEDKFIDDISNIVYEKLNKIDSENKVQVRAGYGHSNIVLQSCYEPYSEHWFKIIGNSMNPKFENGDNVFGKNILSDNWNDKIELVKLFNKKSFFIIDSKEFGLVLKCIQYDNSKIKLLSLNQEFLPLIIENPSDDIQGIWVVKSVNFAD